MSTAAHLVWDTTLADGGGGSGLVSDRTMLLFPSMVVRPHSYHVRCGLGYNTTAHQLVYTRLLPPPAITVLAVAWSFGVPPPVPADIPWHLFFSVYFIIVINPSPIAAGVFFVDTCVFGVHIFFPLICFCLRPVLSPQASLFV